MIQTIYLWNSSSITLNGILLLNYYRNTNNRYIVPLKGAPPVPRGTRTFYGCESFEFIAKDWQLFSSTARKTDGGRLGVIGCCSFLKWRQQSDLQHSVLGNISLRLALDKTTSLSILTITKEAFKWVPRTVICEHFRTVFDFLSSSCRKLFVLMDKTAPHNCKNLIRLNFSTGVVSKWITSLGNFRSNLLSSLGFGALGSWS